MTDCRCGRLTRGETFTCCETCLTDLSAALGEVPWLAGELDTTLARQRSTPVELVGGQSGSLPWHEAAGRARDHLRAVLVSWVLFADEEAVRAVPGAREDIPEDTLAAMSRWLLGRVDGLGQHELGPDAVAAVVSAVDAGRRIIDNPPERWFAGPCAECGADLYAERRHGPVQCPECGQSHDIDEIRDRLLAEAEDRLASATDIARAVSWLGAEPLTPARVWQWAKRGRIIARGHAPGAGGPPVPLYRVGDAIDLLAASTHHASA